MLLHRIKQYRVVDLVRILIYKVIYYFKLQIRQVIVDYFQPKYRVRKDKDVSRCYERVSSSLFSYYGFINRDEKQILSSANIIAEGSINIFGKDYPFNPESDWLKDPVTGNFWPRDTFWNKSRFVEQGLADVKFVLEVNKFNYLVVLGLAYYITKRCDFIKHIERGIDGWISCVPQEKSVANKIAMDFAFRIINLIHISLLCHDNSYFQKYIHPKIIGIIEHHVKHLKENLSSRWFKAGNDNNHNIGEIVGLYVGELWLAEFVPELSVSNRTLASQIKYLQKVINNTISLSGCYLEQSSNYTRVVHDFLLIYQIFKYSLDYNRLGSRVDIDCTFNRLSNYLIDISYSGSLANFGDNDYARVVIPFEDYHDEVAHVKKHCKKLETTGNYTDGGQWIYHSKDENKVYLFTRVGLFASFVEGTYVHSHNDLLSVVLYAKQQSIFIDKGTLFYNSGIDIRKEYSSTRAHNTIQVGNREMTDFLSVGYANYPDSKLLLHEEKEGSCRFKGCVSYKDITHIRDISYDGSSIVITDYVTKNIASPDLGIIRFLLSEELRVDLVDECVTLLDKQNNTVCLVTFENVCSVIVKQTNYAPKYSICRRTNMIEATFEIKKSSQIKTIIKF